MEKPWSRDLNCDSYKATLNSRVDFLVRLHIRILGIMYIFYSKTNFVDGVIEAAKRLNRRVIQEEFARNVLCINQRLFWLARVWQFFFHLEPELQSSF